MPCWFFEKRELKHTPSYRDGVDPDTETRYRREGARFILDTGSKMGLRYETSSTGVVYFHRFYMFHSFREFHRFVTAACCLFLAGKVEETPKKCKDIIKWTKQMLTDAQFQVFGDDPKEEIMTMERILLQTIKFDLMIEHPYYNLLKFAKVLKGDKAKTQSMVQMAWTFINDSLCTTLCLQWESDIIAVALMYLASRLSKIDFNDWQGKQPGFKGKWYEALVEDITVDLIEDICHQVLDLYSSQNKQKEESPPPPPPPPKPALTSDRGGHTPTGSKRTRTATPEGSAQAGPPAKSSRKEGHHRQSHSPSPAGRGESSERDRHGSRSKSGSKNASPKHHGHHPSNPPPGPPGSAPQPPLPAPGQGQPQDGAGGVGFSQYNPYMSSQMFSSSFMSQEGSQNIRHLLGGGPPPPAGGSAPATPAGSYGYPPGTTATQAPAYRPPATSAYPAPSATSYTQPPPAGGSYNQPGTAGYQQGSQPHYGQQGQYSQQQPQGQAQGGYGQYQSQPGYQTNYAQPPPGYSQQGQAQPGGSYQTPNTAQPPPGYSQQQYGGSTQYPAGGGYGGQANAPSAVAGSGGQYGAQRPPYTSQQPNTARPPYPNQQGNVPRQGYPNQQGNVQRPGYSNQQGNYQNYQPPPPNAQMRPHGQGMRPPPRGGPPHQGGFPPRPGGPPGPRGPGQLPPRHGQSNVGNLTAVPIAGRPGGGRYPHH